MTENYSDIPSTNASEEDENTLEKLQKKNERLQTILIKAKGTITQYKSKIDELEKELYETQFKNNELQALNNRLSKLELPKPDSIQETICRVKIFEDVFCYVRSSKGNYWVSDSYYKPKGNIPDLLDYTCTKKNVLDQISNISQDWQEKISKVNEKLIAQESKNISLIELLKDKDIKLDKLEKDIKRYRDTGLSQLINGSLDVYDSILSIILDDSIDNSKISNIQKSLSNFLSSSYEGEASKVKDHCNILLKSMLDITKRLLHARNELKTQDQAWRATCDALLHEKEELKQQISRIKKESNLKYFLFRHEDHKAEVNKIQQEHQNIVENLSQDLKKLEIEVSKGVNIVYLKNVLLQFIFASDYQVKERLLNVISTILCFSSEEVMKIKAVQSHQGVLTKLFNWG
jgi:GRIP domain